MFSEIYFADSVYRHDVSIVNISDKHLLTTVPKTKNHAVNTETDRALKISYPSKDYVHVFDVKYASHKLINSNFFYEFDILSQERMINSRKELRRNVDLPAIFSKTEKTAFQFATVLDISDNGVRIESLKPLDQHLIFLTYQDENKKSRKKSKVAWSKTENGKYYYGLKFVS